MKFNKANCEGCVVWETLLPQIRDNMIKNDICHKRTFGFCPREVKK